MGNSLITLSANTLFHFTNSIDILASILENGFYPKYSYIETCDDNTEDKLETIPMVCFCDIPLAHVKDHITKYGSFGIGLSKEWGRKNKVTPVLYIHENSPIEYNIDRLMKFFFQHMQQVHDQQMKEFEKVLETWINLPKYYFKQYEGRLPKRINGEDRFLDIIRFYDEREWRFVPSIDTLKDNNIPTTLSEGEIKKSTILEKNHDLLKKFCNLSFKLSDIKYLIIESEEQFSDLLRRLCPIDHDSKYKDSALLRINILTKDQIFEDF